MYPITRPRRARWDKRRLVAASKTTSSTSASLADSLRSLLLSPAAASATAYARQPEERRHRSTTPPLRSYIFGTNASASSRSIGISVPGRYRRGTRSGRVAPYKRDHLRVLSYDAIFILTYFFTNEFFHVTETVVRIWVYMQRYCLLFTVD